MARPAGEEAIRRLAASLCYAQGLAHIYPFRPYRYSAAAGPAEQLVTQPYDKISPAMQARYLSLSPHNLVRVILGERKPADNESENVYTRAAHYLDEWIRQGTLTRDPKPGLYAYFQEFTVPDSGQKLTRKGFIGLGAVEDYSQGVVHRHEQTLSGPKKDRLELLRHTHSHFGLLFMLYPDREGAVDRLLDEAAQAQPLLDVKDEYDAVHRVWRISDPARVAEIQRLMGDKKLLIADGHHRYETAIAFRNENPDLAGAKNVMMAFVSMYSPGLKILATHRVVRNLPDFKFDQFLQKVGARYQVSRFSSLDLLKRGWESEPGTVRIGVAVKAAPAFFLLERPREAGEMDVPILHKELLEGVLGIGEEAVRDEKFLRYVRGIDVAVDEVRKGDAPVAFLLEPTPIDDMARIAFAGGVMPQKSTDFYPKLLSGLTIYKVDA